LLDAAERAIRRVGPNASMDELAAEAGITKPILYSHFGDRAGLAEAMADRTADMLITAVGDALRTAAATGSAEDVTRSAVMAFCDFIESDPSVYRFLVRSTFDRGSPVSSRLATGVAGRISSLLSRALKQVDGPTEAAEPWAYGMVGLGFAGAEWWLGSDTMTKEDLVDYLTQLLWVGLAGAGLDKLSVKDASAFVDLVAAEESQLATKESPRASTSPAV
jgi:AcrR family transcriptional regulator